MILLDVRWGQDSAQHRILHEEVSCLFVEVSGYACLFVVSYLYACLFVLSYLGLVLLWINKVPCSCAKYMVYCLRT